MATSVLISDGPTAWKCLNGLFCIYKPINKSVRAVKAALITNIVKSKVRLLIVRNFLLLLRLALWNNEVFMFLHTNSDCSINQSIIKIESYCVAILIEIQQVIQPHFQIKFS